MSRSERHAGSAPRIRVYSTGFCPSCMRAEQLLRKKGFEAIDKVRVDLDPARRNEMMLLTGKRTVPQIYIGDVYVGGCDELYALERTGELDSLLEGANA